MENQEELLYKIALTHLPNVGAILTRNLVGFSGGVEAVFQQKKSQLLKIPGIGIKTAEDIVGKKTFQKAEKELKYAEENNVRVLFYLDDDYPFRLKRIRDAPTLLYFKGVANLNAEKVLSIVGTRKPSIYGINQCEQLVAHLREMGVLIISGLAYGIDITAHRKAIDVGLPTVGVMGNGLDRIYPAGHRKTAMEMVNSGGLITEFGKGTLPDREHFPMRNRIIAGMCDALVVVESDIKGGSMISAEMANGYNKDVFAVPGRIGDQWSRGCNYLIKSNKAALMDSPDEVSRTMQWQPQTKPQQIQRACFLDLSKDEEEVFENISSQDPVSIDKLFKESNFTSSQLATILLTLEFQGLIRALPGKLYLRV